MGVSMAFKKKEQFDISVVRQMVKNQKYIDNCPISNKTLEDIFDDYNAESKNELKDIKDELLSIITPNLPSTVHSVRGRVKDPYHLIEKIIRNASENPDKYKNIALDNYNKILTDLIGIRIILLDKRDWKEVHKCLLKLFKNDKRRFISESLGANGYIKNYNRYFKSANEIGNELKNSYHAEMPKAYITTDDDIMLYSDSRLQVDRSKTGYRSVHYIIRYKKVFFEIQVRTLFEEGWLEFDHRIKYPYDKDNPKKKQYVEVLNSLAQAADKLISFYDKSDFEKYAIIEEQESIIDNKINETKQEDKNVSLEQKLIKLF